jgi:hypothetical protein
MDIWNKFVNNYWDFATLQQPLYTSLNTDDVDKKIIDIWADDEGVMNQSPLPKMISISGQTYISLEGVSPPYDGSHQGLVTQKILTSKGYLNSTELRKTTEQTHLEFTYRTYYQHVNESMKFCVKSVSSGCFFFINGLFPDCFPYAATDKIILLSENILEKYSDILDNQALLATGVSISSEQIQPKAQPKPKSIPIQIPGNKTRIQHLFQ